MIIEEKRILERKSLQLINRMVYKTQGYYYENGLTSLMLRIIPGFILRARFLEIKKKEKNQ